ncbi:MAG: succinylglutamate desuccinylase/aspartoacylase family protein [Gemmatimonadota bacterium]|nr:succinylglutamate desuccinylase/aspartoacylase family protein [Gemmatimonadota bacterium]
MPAARGDGVMEIGGIGIPPGEHREFDLPLTETTSGGTVSVPVRVWRGAKPGPTVFVAAAVHGDEINGTGIIRTLVLRESLALEAGTLVLVPVVNILGFERHVRYLPDRRDLNRCFPGSERGSFARRFAYRFFEAIVRHCDFGIDLHSAAVRRMNFPNVRANLDDERCRDLAEAFGCELLVHGTGPVGSLRRTATEAGCPTILLEAGEVWKVEPSINEAGVQGVVNVLKHLGMVPGQPERPRFQVAVRKTKWVRARVGGFLEFHVTPGTVVQAGQPIATNTSLLGQEHNLLEAPLDGMVIGMTTLPAVAPGDPVCHLAVGADFAPALVALQQPHQATVYDRVREDLARKVTAVGRDAMPTASANRRGPDDA